ncbi:unnamed protein product [Mucor hiemalis]
MKISSISIAGLVVLSFKSTVDGIPLASRRFATCGYMGGKIYCYGGITSVIQSDTVNNELYSLDINKLTGQTTESINNNWETVQPSASFDTELRRIPNALVLSDGKRLLVQGGYGDVKVKYVNQTIIYDTTTNAWTNGSPYTEANRGIRQIYSATAVNLPNNVVGFYGGFEQLANTAIPQVSASGATMQYWPDNGTAVGYNSIQVYSPDSMSWTQFSPQTGIPANYYPDAQTATLDPNSGKIYYLGGLYYTPTKDEILVPFKWALTFNTKVGLWSNESLSGAVYPSGRQYHTADLLPNSGDIILYGGTSGNDEQGKASTDYCFTLNLSNNQWTEQGNLNVPSIYGASRFSHSSILVNTTLFILFGKGSDGTLQQSMIAFDVSNVSSIAYSATFGAPLNDSSTSNNNHAASSQNKGGIIGGVVAGAVVAVLAIIAAIVCVVRRRRKEHEKKEREKEDLHTSEQIHVDWDTIEDQYREVSPASWSITNSPHSANLTGSSKRESFSHRFSSTVNGNDISVIKPSFEADRGHYAVVKPDAA